VQLDAHSGAERRGKGKYSATQVSVFKKNRHSVETNLKRGCFCFFFWAYQRSIPQKMWVSFITPKFRFYGVKNRLRLRWLPKEQKTVQRRNLEASVVVFACSTERSVTAFDFV
jgi:hypothetical protein